MAELVTPILDQRVLLFLFVWVFLLLLLLFYVSAEEGTRFPGAAFTGGFEPTWVLGTELRPSGRAARILVH